MTRTEFSDNASVPSNDAPVSKTDLEKVAIVNFLVRAGAGLGKKILQKPLASLGTAATVGFTADQMAGAASSAAGRAGKVGLNIPPPGW